MKTKWMALVAGFVLGMAFFSPILAENPSVSNTVYFSQSEQQFHVVSAKHNTPILKFYLYESPGNAYVATSYTGTFHFSTNQYAADITNTMSSITGTVSSNIVSFAVLTNHFTTAVENAYCSVKLATNASQIIFARGLLTVLASPEN